MINPNEPHSAKQISAHQFSSGAFDTKKGQKLGARSLRLQRVLAGRVVRLPPRTPDDHGRGHGDRLLGQALQRRTKGPQGLSRLFLRDSAIWPYALHGRKNIPLCGRKSAGWPLQARLACSAICGRALATEGV